MSEFIFKEIDKEGFEILDNISSAVRFNHWMFSQIEDYCEGEILEIGSGIGNISNFFFEKGVPIYISDLRESYIEYLEKNFSNKATGILNLDIVDKSFSKTYDKHLNHFDSIFALNVVEHIYDDGLAIRNIAKLLKKGGQVTILVPAYQFLFNEFDTSLEHYRRYNKNSLTTLLENNGFVCEESYYFNAVGILGWFVSGSILKNKVIPSSQIKIYEKFVPVIKLFDKLFLRKIGLSVICKARKL